MENAEIKWEIEEEEEEVKKPITGFTEELDDNKNAVIEINVNGNSDYKHKIGEINGGIEVSEAALKEEEDGLNGIDKCVYYLNHQGLWKCRKCSWTYQSRSVSSDDIQNAKQQLHMLTYFETLNQQEPCFSRETKGKGSSNGLSSNAHSSTEPSSPEKILGDSRLDVTITSSDTGKCLSQESELLHERKLKHNSLSGSSLLPSEISPEEDNTSFKFSAYKAVEFADSNVLYESNHEAPELDVESVLKEQDTHDLYCPNCNSCITRRVIIRKRKRRLPNSGDDSKRNKLENIMGSEATSVLTTSSPAHDTVDSCLDGSVLPASDNHDQEQEPDVFRCLSCFSIFTSKGNGFKLFRIFGDRREEDNLQDSPQTPVFKKSWFSSLFQSNNGASGRAYVETDETEALIPLNSEKQNGGISSVNESPSNAQTYVDEEPVKKGINRSKEGGTNNLVSQKDNVAEPGNLDNLEDQVAMNLNKQNSEASVHEAPSYAVYGDGVVQSETAGSKKDGASLEQSRATFSLPESSNFSKEMLLDHEGGYPEITLAGTPQTNAGEATEISTFIPQQNGLKFLISSKVGSFTVENSKTDQMVNTAIPNKNPDEKETAFSLQSPVSFIQDAYTDSKVNISSNISLDNGQNSGAVAKTQNGEVKIHKVNNTIIVVETSQVEPAAAQRVQDITDHPAETENLQNLETQIQINEQEGISTQGIQGLEIIKSIVYGGLVESIASLGVVSSAAGSDASTLNVLALGVANLVGGLIVIGHNLWELKSDHKIEPSEQLAKRQVDHYDELLGRRRNFLLHAVFVILSFLTFGLLPPVIYGFSFWKSDNKDLKLVTVAAASLLSIITLAAGKAYIKRPPKSYIKTVCYYVVMGLMGSGVSYAVGNLIKMFLEKLGILHASLAVSLSETGSVKSAWASY